MIHHTKLLAIVVVLLHGVLRMRIRELISDNTSEVPACVDPLLEGESCSVATWGLIRENQKCDLLMIYCSDVVSAVYCQFLWLLIYTT